MEMGVVNSASGQALLGRRPVLESPDWSHRLGQHFTQCLFHSDHLIQQMIRQGGGRDKVPFRND
jgi:hypothetical protein